VERGEKRKEMKPGLSITGGGCSTGAGEWWKAAGRTERVREIEKRREKET